MSRAASLPGADIFLKNPTFFVRSHLSRAASLPGAELWADFCLKKQLVLGNFAAWGSFSRKSIFLNKPLVPGSFAAWGQIFSQNMLFFFEQATCPGQLRCLGQNLFLKSIFCKKQLVPGSFAAWGRTFSRNSFFVRSNLSRAASLPGADFSRNLFF